MNERSAAAAFFGFLCGITLMAVVYAILFSIGLEVGEMNPLAFAIAIVAGTFAATLFGVFAVVLSMGE